MTNKPTKIITFLTLLLFVKSAFALDSSYLEELNHLGKTTISIQESVDEQEAVGACEQETVVEQNTTGEQEATDEQATPVEQVVTEKETIPAAKISTPVEFFDDFSKLMLSTLEKVKSIEPHEEWKEKTRWQIAINGLTGPLTHTFRLTSPFFWHLYSKLLTHRNSYCLTPTNAPKLHALIQAIAQKLNKTVPTIILHENKQGFDLYANAIDKQNIVLCFDQGLLELLNEEELESLIAQELMLAASGRTYVQKGSRFAYSLATAIVAYKVLTNRLGFLEINKLKGLSPFLLLSGATAGFYTLHSFLNRLQERRTDFLAAQAVGNPKALISALQKLEEKEEAYKAEYEKLSEVVGQAFDHLEKLPFKGKLLKTQVYLLSFLKKTIKYLATQSPVAHRNKIEKRIRALEKMMVKEEEVVED
ncbi:M48 family metalloprotease [Candidatus Babeliales bacterium]|nr:M48 family metalloprotease [Candidatus Babeliales bacterium]